MIKIKQMIKEAYTRLQLLPLIELINLKLKNNLDCSLYLFDFDLPNNIYKKILFDKNTNVNLFDKWKNTPLIYTSAKNEVLKVKLLLTHPDIDVNLKGSSYYSALSKACDKDNLLTVKILLTNPDIDVNTRDYCNRTPLLNACRNFNILIIKLLLVHPDIDVNAKSKTKFTALHEACLYNYIQAVKLLLSYPGININALNERREKPEDLTTYKRIKELFNKYRQSNIKK